ncbi:MAG: hypothetical protein K1X72_09505 [Pyrinomonadaceae bacterium]|nr:hypothetical protein [Pyrinomonadaceae bacterium]
MKQIFILFLLTFALGFSAYSQNRTNNQPLPKNISKWNGSDSDKVLNDPVIKSRLKKLLGKKNYADFIESWETINPIVKKGNFLFSSGCMIHSCGHIESAFAIDLLNKTIHAAIFRETEKTRFFNEKNRKTPNVIQKWAKNLQTK